MQREGLELTDGPEWTLDQREEKRLMGDRRSQIDRRASRASQQPSDEQLALFAKRVRRAIRDEGSRHIFGIASGESDFSGYPDVLRTLD